MEWRFSNNKWIKIKISNIADSYVPVEYGELKHSGNMTRLHPFSLAFCMRFNALAILVDLLSVTVNCNRATRKPENTSTTVYWHSVEQKRNSIQITCSARMGHSHFVDGRDWTFENVSTDQHYTLRRYTPRTTQPWRIYDKRINDVKRFYYCYFIVVRVIVTCGKRADNEWIEL